MPEKGKDDYEQEAMCRGATLCIDKINTNLLKDKLAEYICRQLSYEQARHIKSTI